MKHKWIADKSFYRQVMAIAIPIIIQNGITNFVSLLDNIMVGQVGTLQMSGVSIVNQLLLVFMLTIFGLNSGSGIFTTQFYGSCDNEGIRYTVRHKVLFNLLVDIAFVVVLIPWGAPLTKLFLLGEGTAEDASLILQYSLDYLHVMLWGLIPFALSSAYSSTLRECGHSVVPMVAGTVAVFVNLILNYIFIFGHLGLPAMGVKGAALATVISRFCELAIVVIWSHRNIQKVPFMAGLYRSAYIPGKLLKQITLKGLPLILNEMMWSAGIVFLNQCYSTCGLNVVSAINIASTVNNLASVVTMALANTIGILMGRMLGSQASKTEVRTANRHLMVLSIACGALFGIFLAAIAVPFPRIYNTTEDIRRIATMLIMIYAVLRPFLTYTLCAYYTIRSGGKTMSTFFYDSGFMYLATLPLALILSRFTDLSIVPLFFLCQLPDVFKCILAYYMVKRDSWMHVLSSR